MEITREDIERYADVGRKQSNAPGFYVEKFIASACDFVAASEGVEDLFACKRKTMPVHRLSDMMYSKTGMIAVFKEYVEAAKSNPSLINPTSKLTRAMAEAIVGMTAFIDKLVPEQYDEECPDDGLSSSAENFAEFILSDEKTRQSKQLGLLEEHADDVSLQLESLTFRLRRKEDYVFSKHPEWHEHISQFNTVEERAAESRAREAWYAKLAKEYVDPFSTLLYSIRDLRRERNVYPRAFTLYVEKYGYVQDYAKSIRDALRMDLILHVTNDRQDAEDHGTPLVPVNKRLCAAKQEFLDVLEEYLEERGKVSKSEKAKHLWFEAQSILMDHSFHNIFMLSTMKDDEIDRLMRYAGEAAFEDWYFFKTHPRAKCRYRIVKSSHGGREACCKVENEEGELVASDLMRCILDELARGNALQESNHSALNKAVGKMAAYLSYIDGGSLSPNEKDPANQKLVVKIVDLYYEKIKGDGYQGKKRRNALTDAANEVTAELGLANYKTNDAVRNAADRVIKRRDAMYAIAAVRQANQ